jgi:hypothetical protein
MGIWQGGKGADSSHACLPPGTCNRYECRAWNAGHDVWLGGMASQANGIILRHVALEPVWKRGEDGWCSEAAEAAVHVNPGRPPPFLFSLLVLFGVQSEPGESSLSIGIIHRLWAYILRHI